MLSEIQGAKSGSGDELIRHPIDASSSGLISLEAM